MLIFTAKKMDKAVNDRLATWYNTLKAAGILSSQEDLRSVLRNEKGKRPSQPFISNVLSGTSAAPQRMLVQLAHAFTFTPLSFFEYGEGTMMEYDKLLNFLLDRHNMTKKELVDELNDKYITQPTLSKLNNLHEESEWDAVFSYFNAKFGYTISATAINNAQRNIGIVVDRSDQYVSEQAERLVKFVERMKYLGEIATDKEFCAHVGISPQQYSNMKDIKQSQDVTKALIVSVMKAFPRLNPDWLILGTGEMLRSASDSFPMLYEIKEQLDRNTRMIEKIYSHLFEGNNKMAS